MHKDRNSNIELLRILAMFSVILLHANEFILPIAGLGFERKIFVFLESCCISAVDIFVVITGYFLITKNKRSLGKTFGLVFVFLFFNEFFYFFDIAFGKEIFSVAIFLKKLIPTSYFITLYIILYFFSPFLNFLLNRLNDNNWKMLIILLLLVYSFFATGVDLFSELTKRAWLGISPIGIWGNQQGFNIVNFVLLYIVGAYIRMFDLPLLIRKRKPLILCLCYILIFAWAELCDLLQLFGLRSAWVYHNPLVILSAVLTFKIFLELQLQSKLVNFFAKFAFPVYVIHPFLLKHVDWSFVHNSLEQVLAYLLVIMLATYMLSALLYSVYQLFLGRLLNRLDKKCISIVQE